MKILEIIDVKQHPNKSYRGYFRTKNNSDKNISSIDSDEKTLGTGFFSTVKSVNDDPHVVKKYKNRFDDGVDDKYWKYIKIIIDEKLWENPYFPRVYETQTYVDKGENELPTAKIEKLDSKVNRKEAIYLFNKMFEHEVDITGDAANTIVEKIAYILVNITGGSSPFHSGKVKVKDPLLKQALEKLIDIRILIDAADIDIHENNIMFRRGTTGLQLVLTDPFSF